MSSPRKWIPGDAIVMQANQPVGPLLMPSADPVSFVDEFNRTYQSIGLKLRLSENTDQQEPARPTEGE
ncbi:MAG: hypothetical protein AAGA03_00390 [Planctomycetota bacterium]